MWPAKVPSNPAFKSCMKRKVCVRAGVGHGSFSLNPPKNGNWTVQDRGKPLPTHCPGSRFASSASLYAALGMWSMLVLMEGLPIPSDPRDTTGTGSTSLLLSGSPRKGRCPFSSFSHWPVEPWHPSYEIQEPVLSHLAHTIIGIHSKVETFGIRPL